MSTLTIAPTTATRPTHAPGFTDLLRSEWTKFKTLRSTWWSLGAMLFFSLGMSILLTSLFTAHYATLGPEDKASFGNDTIGLILQPGAQLGELALTVLGVLLISSEFSTGMIKATVLAAPRRTAIFLHLSHVDAKLGARVKKGETIAASGAPVVRSRIDSSSSFDG